MASARSCPSSSEAMVPNRLPAQSPLPAQHLQLQAGSDGPDLVVPTGIAQCSLSLPWVSASQPWTFTVQCLWLAGASEQDGKGVLVQLSHSSTCSFVHAFNQTSCLALP